LQDEIQTKIEQLNEEWKQKLIKNGDYYAALSKILKEQASLE